MASRSVGEILQAKRKKAQLSLKQLANRTRINQAYLEALEQNQWQKLPEIGLIKGYINAYAQVIGFDASLALALLRRDYPKQSLSVPLSFSSGRRQIQLRRLVSSWPVLGFLSLVLVVVFYLVAQWFQANRPPSIVLYTPKSQTQVSKVVEVSGVTEANAKLLVNGQPVALNPDGSFQTQVSFPASGPGAVVVEAEDNKGRKTTIVRQVIID